MKDSRINITSFYVNTHRIMEQVGIDNIPRHLSQRMQTMGLYQHDKGMVAAAMGPVAVEMIQKLKVEPLEQQLLKGTLRTGGFFTFEARFRSHGLSERDASKNKGMVTLKCDLSKLGIQKELAIEFNQANLTTDSAWSALSGQPSVFVFGHIYAISETQIKARPFVIGELVIDNGRWTVRYRDSLELFAQNFDALKEVKFPERPKTPDLLRLKDVPEKTVKEAFAHIFGEGHVPNDWGGETCDLFSSNVFVDQERYSAAFFLKGPSKFKPLQIADCGKNGDQIQRLNEAPADVLVVQHCHYVQPAVRKHLLGLARGDFNFPKKYCVIDGHETLAILKHFGYI